MSSQKTNLNLFKNQYSKNYIDFNNLKSIKIDLLKTFIQKKFTYLNLSFFRYIPYNKNIHLLVWYNKNLKIYKYIKKKKKIVSLKNSLILKSNKLKYKKKVFIFNKLSILKISQLKLIILKLLINKFFFNKFIYFFSNYNVYDLYGFNFKKTKIKKLKKKNFFFFSLLSSFLKTLYIPKYYNKIHKEKRNYYIIQLIFGCLMKNVDFVAKILAQMIEENRSQHIIFSFIDYLFKTIPLLLLNINGLIIKIKGKFLKKFGNKKVRTSKRLIVLNKKNFSLQEISSPIIYSFSYARTAVGLFGIHLWFKL